MTGHDDRARDEQPAPGSLPFERADSRFGLPHRCQPAPPARETPAGDERPYGEFCIEHGEEMQDHDHDDRARDEQPSLSNDDVAAAYHLAAERVLRQLDDEQPAWEGGWRSDWRAPTAREIPADELAEAKSKVALALRHAPLSLDAWDEWVGLLDVLDERGRERDAARAEVERLHTWAGLMSLLDEHYPADVVTVALVRELERLRTELTKSDSARLGLDYDLGAAQSERDAARAEVERLREAVTAEAAAKAEAMVTADTWKMRHDAARAEVEQMSRHADRLGRQIDKQRAEVERLREDASVFTKAIDEYRAELERLRARVAELEPIEQRAREVSASMTWGREPRHAAKHILGEAP